MMTLKKKFLLSQPHLRKNLPEEKEDKKEKKHLKNAPQKTKTIYDQKNWSLPSLKFFS